MPPSSSKLIVCHACDLVHRQQPVAGGARVRCARCRAELYRTHSGDIDTPIALATTALVLMALSNAFPLVAFQLNGTTRVATLTGAAWSLSEQGYTVIAAVVFFTTLLVPLTQSLALLYLLVPLRANRRAYGQNALFRLLTRIRPWGMVEVFILGTLVALVRLSSMAEVIPGTSLYAFVLLMLTLSALTSATPTEQFWRWVQGSGP